MSNMVTLEEHLKGLAGLPDVGQLWK